MPSLAVQCWELEAQIGVSDCAEKITERAETTP